MPKIHRIVRTVRRNGEMPKTPKRGPGRPPKPMPERIPDTPDNVARAVLNTPPKSKGDWDYLKKEPKGS